MTDKLFSLMKFWPVAMLVLAAVSSSFAFYYQMQKLHSDFIELEKDIASIQKIQSLQMRRESMELEFKLRDTQITDLKAEFKSWSRQQESINRDFEDDIKYLHRNTR